MRPHLDHRRGARRYHAVVHRAKVLGVGGAAVIALVLGFLDTAAVLSTRTTEPRWQGVLAPLHEAPLERHEVTLLSLPSGIDAERSKVLLFEAAWQRPGVRWATAADPEAATATAAVTVAGAPPPPGWNETWRRGEIGVWRRGRP